MNRFRTTKKKAKDSAEDTVRPLADFDAPSLPSLKPSKTFKKSKKSAPEAQPEFDLSTALPSSDDFRTSLLMSGLSARFSMLREQDDPYSKVGKASDDSVLFPSKRQSRLNDFGYMSQGLSDIAEVSSINGSIRPPFAYDRKNSSTTMDSYGTDDDSLYGGSIMNRPKLGEGNNLFGGRQKIYKIPANSTKSYADSAGAGMGGRALYDDDVSLSAFQKLRQREKEQQRTMEEDEEPARSSSPPLSGYNRNRETSSTTSSAGPSITRSSTAATSFTSQRTPSVSGSHSSVTVAPTSNGTGLERSMTKGRRLYETGLDQQLQDQQSSAMNRIDTLTRQRTFGVQTPPLVSPMGTTTANDRWDRQQIAGKASMPNLRAASPPPSKPVLSGFDFGVKPINTENKQTLGMSTPPLSPPVSENEVPGVQPNDRGKATALGAFSKPSQPYDESKYSQRQLQMQQGRETPPLRRPSPSRAFQSRQPSVGPSGRPRGDSNSTYTSNRSRSTSSAQRQFLPRDRFAELAPSARVSEEQGRSGNFLASPNGSILESNDDVERAPEVRMNIKPSELYDKYRQEQVLALQRPPESQHPAHRQRPFETQDSASNSKPITPSESARTSEEDTSTSTVSNNDPADSPTLGPTNGLSGMVRQHLRSDSGASSIYGNTAYSALPSAGLVSRFPQDPMEPMPTITNPWEGNSWDEQDQDKSNDPSNDAKVSESVPTPLHSRSPNVSTVERPKSAWEKELEIRHAKHGSTETQKEQLDFHLDLAARRRKVQENLKSFVETESRSGSPSRGPEWAREISKQNPLGLLKKSSRGSLMTKSKEPKEPTQSKAIKKLGLSGTVNNSATSLVPSIDENSWKKEEEETVRGTSPAASIPAQTKAFRRARRDAQRDRERQLAMRHQSRSNSVTAGEPGPRDASREGTMPPRHRSPSREDKYGLASVARLNGSSQESQSRGSATSNQSGSRSASRTSRDRSSSDASGRGESQVRNGRYTDELTGADDHSNTIRGLSGELSGPSRLLVAKSPTGTSAGFQRSPNSSPGPSSARVMSSGRSDLDNSDHRNLHPLQTGAALENASRGHSPITPFSPASSSTQGSPLMSGSNTPSQGFQSQSRLPTDRKRSINKSDISEPRFISSTSRITTVNLPPGSSLQNGAEMVPPPIPPVNPKRKTRAMFGFGRKESEFDDYSLLSATQSTEEMSTFSADEDSKPTLRSRLRKSSSEGGNLNARARQLVASAPSPPLPATVPATRDASPPSREGAMF